MKRAQDISRREAIIKAAKAGAYAAPVILSATVPAAVGAQVRVSGQPTTVDLAVAESVTPVSGVVPTNATFTVTVTNNGPAVASAITVLDTLDPTAFMFQNATTSQGTYNAATGVWTIPSLALRATATLTINVLAIAIGQRTNTATLTGSTPPDSNAANNQGSATFTGIPSTLIGG